MDKGQQLELREIGRANFNNFKFIVRMCSVTGKTAVSKRSTFVECDAAVTLLMSLGVSACPIQERIPLEN